MASAYHPIFSGDIIHLNVGGTRYDFLKKFQLGEIANFIMVKRKADE